MLATILRQGGGQADQILLMESFNEALVSVIQRQSNLLSRLPDSNTSGTLITLVNFKWIDDQDLGFRAYRKRKLPKN